MALHAQGERFQTAEHKKAIERALDRADGILQEPHSIPEFFVVSDNRNAADYVGMTVQILRRRMNDNVEAKFDWSLDPWRSEGVCL